MLVPLDLMSFVKRNKYFLKETVAVLNIFSLIGNCYNCNQSKAVLLIDKTSEALFYQFQVIWHTLEKFHYSTLVFMAYFFMHKMC